VAIACKSNMVCDVRALICKKAYWSWIHWYDLWIHIKI